MGDDAKLAPPPTQQGGKRKHGFKSIIPLDLDGPIILFPLEDVGQMPIPSILEALVVVAPFLLFFIICNIKHKSKVEKIGLVHH